MQRVKRFAGLKELRGEKSFIIVEGHADKEAEKLDICICENHKIKLNNVKVMV